MTFLGIEKKVAKKSKAQAQKSSKGQNWSFENMWHNNKKTSHYDT